jgi:hypothetical protein
MNRLGANTMANMNSDNVMLVAGSLLGVWFSDQILDCYSFAHQYEVNDVDFMVVDDLQELTGIIYGRIQDIESISEYELFRNETKLMDIMVQVRESLIEDGYTGIYVNDDEEFGGTSLIVIDLDCIN